MARTHLDLGELESLRTGEGTPEEREHLAGCAACRSEAERLAQLTGALKEPEASPYRVPASIGESVRQEYRRSRNTRSRSVLAPIALAAALLLGILVLFFTGTPKTDPGDVDRSGNVDILDAFKLSLALDAGEPAAPEHDLTGDGVVDGRDVEAIARLSVRVEEESQ